MTQILLELLEINLAAAGATLAVLLLRKPVHLLLGPSAAYLIWTIVPVAMLATLLPSREVTVAMLDARPADASFPSVLAAALLFVWLAGAVVMIARMVARQRMFLRDVELGVGGPAVVGFFYPYIVTPSDFERRFGYHERKLILAHEQVHLERYDARINGVVALARCLMWFNPLVHLGARNLRADQEVSCDATVMDRRPKARKVYAETLLKTHLALRPLPVGCYWPPTPQHPLTQRIAMLTRSPFSFPRRLAAAGVVVAMVGAGGVAAWAAQPAREVIEDLPEIFVTFESVVGDDFRGIQMRLLPAETAGKPERPPDPA